MITAQRVVARWKSASIQTIWVTGGDRLPYASAVWEMYKASYQKIGMHVSSTHELNEYNKWALMLDDEAPVAFSLFKTTRFGLKTGLAGSDGTATGKGAIKKMIVDRFRDPGVYGEVSHAVEALTSTIPVVCVEYVAEILGKVVIPQPDGIHYQRKLEGLGMVIKKMVGHPKGIPVGSGGGCPIPENPGEPLKPGESLEKTAAEKLSQALDLAEHAACQLELD